ncbi:MAG: hypothetical protein AAGA69_00445 [Pseudomonadota bacterium]
MAHPPPIGPALTRLEGALRSLELSLEAIGPLTPGEHPEIARQFNALEAGIDQAIAEVKAALGDQKTPGKPS